MPAPRSRRARATRWCGAPDAGQRCGAGRERDDHKTDDDGAGHQDCVEPGARIGLRLSGEARDGERSAGHGAGNREEGTTGRDGESHGHGGGDQLA